MLSKIDTTIFVLMGKSAIVFGLVPSKKNKRIDPIMIKEIVMTSTILETRENLKNLLFNTMSETTQKLSDPINIKNAKIDNIRQSS